MWTKINKKKCCFNWCMNVCMEFGRWLLASDLNCVASSKMKQKQKNLFIIGLCLFLFHTCLSVSFNSFCLFFFVFLIFARPFWFVKCRLTFFFLRSTLYDCKIFLHIKLLRHRNGNNANFRITCEISQLTRNELNQWTRKKEKKKFDQIELN